MKLPQGIELNVNFPSASDTAWQRAASCRGPLAEPCKHSISETSSEYKKIWTPNIGLPWKKKNQKERHNYKRKDLIELPIKLKINHATLVWKFQLTENQNILWHPYKRMFNEAIKANKNLFFVLLHVTVSQIQVDLFTKLYTRQ
jgi:hypothetical protein